MQIVASNEERPCVVAAVPLRARCVATAWWPRSTAAGPLHRSFYHSIFVYLLDLLSGDLFILVTFDDLISGSNRRRVVYLNARA